LLALQALCSTMSEAIRDSNPTALHNNTRQSSSTIFVACQTTQPSNNTVVSSLEQRLFDRGSAVFKAHSVRDASTSSAFKKGVHIRDILSMAN